MGKDDYGRALGICFVADIELNAEIVGDGRALAL